MTFGLIFRVCEEGGEDEREEDTPDDFKGEGGWEE